MTNVTEEQLLQYIEVLKLKEMSGVSDRLRDIFGSSAAFAAPELKFKSLMALQGSIVTRVLTEDPANFTSEFKDAAYHLGNYARAQAAAMYEGKSVGAGGARGGFLR